MMTKEHNKPLMRCLGEFVGHIVRAVKSTNTSSEVNRTVKEKTDRNVTLRRTTIDEIEIQSQREDES